MLFNQKMYRAFGVAIPAITTLLLLGILKAIFQMDVNTNLFNTGITPGIILGLANAFVAIAVYKNRV